MTFTIAEVFLLLWAVGSSVAAIYWYREREIAKTLFFELLENEEARDRMVKDLAEAKARCS